MSQLSFTEMSALVDRWVAAGTITAAQAERIRADYATLAPKRPVSLVAEGLGYLGGVIVVVGLSLVLSLSWNNLTTGGRIGVATGIATAFLVAGAFIPVPRLGAAGARLRGVLWAAATVPVFAAAALTGEHVLRWVDHSERVPVLAAGSAAVISAVLWTVNRHLLQHLSTVVWLTVAAFAVSRLLSDSWLQSGLAVWGVGVVWFVLSLPGLIPQREGGILGAVGSTIGGVMMLGEEWGPLVALGTVLLLVLTAVMRRDLGLLATSSIGTLIVLPFAVMEYLPGGVLSTALALVGAGLALVATGVYTSRRRRDLSPA